MNSAIGVREQFKTQKFYKLSLTALAIILLAIMNESYQLLVIPFGIFCLLLSLFAFDKLVLLITFATPLAININNIGGGFGMSLPSEPLTMLAFLIFGINILIHGHFDRRILTHPITWVLAINIMWLLFTSFTSSMQLVSFKFVLSRIWYVTVFYLYGTQLFSKYGNIRLFVWLYCLAMIIVIGYTLYNHYGYGWTERSAHWVMTPFYNDHTAYAAALAMFMPLLLLFAFYPPYSFSLKTTAKIVFVIFTLAIVLSYTRAAWLSLVGALAVYIIMRIKLRFTYLLLIVAASAGIFFAIQEDVFRKLEKNRQDSSSNIGEHIKSIGNIKTDASNLERLNRWNSAKRMFMEKPILGWGPGTYKFKYAPFQVSHEMTIISTNSGTRGNAHSEYLGPLAEAGILGLVTWLLIIAVILYKAITLYSQVQEPENRLMIMGCLLGIITYLIHGFLNNFLDSDKAAIPFWGFTAIIVAIDVYHKKNSNLV